MTLEIQNLHVRTEEREILHGVDLTVRKGEFLAVMGASGSGKSTLVRLLSTLLLHDGGTARVFGHDVFKEPRAVSRLVNRVSVEASFFKKMSAVENLSYAARFHGLTAGQTRAAIPTILARVGFPADRRNEPMENLSRGMQQKVALARALVADPQGVDLSMGAEDGAVGRHGIGEDDLTAGPEHARDLFEHAATVAAVAPEVLNPRSPSP
jgi:ABC-type multidrug transport system ATPase subunit